MPVTVQQIADLAGVSRGTVDRALNNRGGIRPEIEKKIKDLAERLDYRPNVMAKSLANARKKITIGVLVNSGGNPFFDKVLAGLEQSSLEIAGFFVRVEMRTLTGYDVEEQLATINEMAQLKVAALVITAINDERIAVRLDALSKKGVEIVTLNSDISGLDRLCFVGCNYFKSGQTAADLMRVIAPPHTRIGIITGAATMLGHIQRIDGFKNVLAKHPDHDIMVTATVECFDDDDRAYAVTKQLLSDNSEINALYFCAGGVGGGMKAVCESERKLTIITVDETENVINHVMDGKIAFTVCQQPYKQGYDSVKIAFEKVVENREPAHKHMYTHNEIKARYNIDEN